MWQFLSLGNSNLIWCDQICLSNGKSSSNRRFERPFLSDFLYDIQAKNPQAPIHSPLTIAYVNVIEWYLICWLFYSFCKSFSFAFFSFESVRIFCPTFHNLRWCVLNTFALHKSKHRFCPLLINECKKKSFCQKQKADVRTVIVVAKMMSHRSASAQWPKNRKISQKWGKLQIFCLNVVQKFRQKRSLKLSITSTFAFG